MRIAILLATFNRKEKTIDCLKRVQDQVLPDNLHIEIFLTDDASNDGTANEVKILFPHVNVYHGTGSLYWAGGMRYSWRKALEKDFNYFLLLNDDTFLFKHSIATLVKSNLDFYKQKTIHGISIGSTRDIQTGITSYGGRKLYSKYKPQSYLVQSNTYNIECDLGEANIMLVPKEIVQKIGILSPKYTHAIADHDYTLKAIKGGFKVIVAPGILGTCTNDHGKPWKSRDVSLSGRIKYLYSFKGLNYKEYLFYIREHYPFHLPFAIFKLWLKTLFPFVYDEFKKY